MKTIVVEIPDNISVKATTRAIKDNIFVSLGSICTVRELPGTGEGEKSCENCGNNRGRSGMPCLLCGGAIDPPDFSHWQPIPPGKVDPASGPMPSKTAALLAGLEDDKLDKVDDKNLCVCHYQSNPECQICNNPQYKNEYCLNCGHHKSCHSKG